MKSIAVLAVLAILMFPVAANAGGWVCSESSGQLQKYRRVGDTIVTEGDPFSVLLEVQAKKHGTPYVPDFVWKVTLDDKVGFAATITVSSERATDKYPYTYLNVLLINKTNGNFRHIAATSFTEAVDDFHGACTTY